MKYIVKFTSKFKSDYKRAIKRGYNSDDMEYVINLIAEGTNQDKLINLYNDHALTGNWKGFRECHVKPDWLLIYELIDDIMVLSLSRTGSHSELFKK